MTQYPESTGPGKALTLVVCGAGPASEVSQLISQAQERDWDVRVVATPAALEFIDDGALLAQTGHPVRSQYRQPGEPRQSTRADVVIVAPASFNTINKWAAGISDNYALGILAEAPGLRIPVVVLPFVNAALAARPAYQRSVAALKAESVRVLDGDPGVRPHPPGTGGPLARAFPWHLALDVADVVTMRRNVSEPETGPRNG